MKIRFFDFAKKLTKNSSHKQHKLGCVIVKKNKIISFGWNQNKTHSKSPHPFKTIHAEIHAILNCGESSLKDCIVYVYRETKQGELALARPCETCMEALVSAGARMVCYTSENGFKTEMLEAI